MVTYSDLERIYRLEKNTPTLQNIPEDFYAQALKLAESPEAGEHREHILDLLNEIYERRRSKILLHAARTATKPAEPDNALNREMKLYHDLINALETNRKQTMERKIEGPENKPPPKTANLKIRLLQAIPVIMASNQTEYGPYKADEVVELPEDSARILVKNGIAEELVAGA